LRFCREKIVLYKNGEEISGLDGILQNFCFDLQEAEGGSGNEAAAEQPLLLPVIASTTAP
jgi:hypothetical protein